MLNILILPDFYAIKFPVTIRYSIKSIEVADEGIGGK